MRVLRLMRLNLALLVAQLVRRGVCDLPVHCVRHQVVGDWEFTVGASSDHRSSCGHKHPDNQNAQPPLDSVSPATRSLRLSLQDPSTVVSADGTQSGTWTMIYDEGFEVAIGGEVFVAFSSFSFAEGANGQKTNVSHCGATQVGWYHNVERTQFGCYTGKKLGAEPAALPPAPVAAADSSSAAADAEADDDAETDDDDAGDDSAAPPTAAPKAAAPAAPRPRASLSSIASLQNFLGPEPAAARSPPQSTDDDQEDGATSGASVTSGGASVTTDVLTQPDSYKPWIPASAGFDHPMQGVWQQSVADALNFLQLGWVAVAYSKFEGKTPRELNRLAGVRHSRPKPARRPKAPEASSFSSFLGLGSRVRRGGGDMESFDWRQRDGQNWLTPVVTQGDCGSCYTISTVHMLTARNRIAKKDPGSVAFSVSFPLYCSEYNQGCDGGYGFLQSKWSEDVGLVPESCSPFSEGGGKCGALQDCDLGATRFRAMNHHYVGGYYGGSDEASIRRELVQNGPVVMSFEPREDFMYYKNGVYKSGAQKIHQEWMQVDHAVLLIAYGVQHGTQYWTMQNSWGSDWGEDGYFRMARGIDESGCESIVVAADVVEENNNDVLDRFLASL